MYLGYYGLSFLWQSCAGNSDLIWPQTLKDGQYSTLYTHIIIFPYTVLDTYEEHIDYSVNKGLSYATSKLRYGSSSLDQTLIFESKALVWTVYSFSI